MTVLLLLDPETCHSGTRPSEFVCAVNDIGGSEDEMLEEERRVRRMSMLAAGVPVRVSRMWQVIGGRAGMEYILNCGV